MCEISSTSNIAFNPVSLFVSNILSPSFISFISCLSKSIRIGIVQGISFSNRFSFNTFSKSFLHKNPSRGENTPFAIFSISSAMFVFISNFVKFFVSGFFFLYFYLLVFRHVVVS